MPISYTPLTENSPELKTLDGKKVDKQKLEKRVPESEALIALRKRYAIRVSRKIAECSMRTVQTIATSLIRSYPEDDQRSLMGRLIQATPKLINAIVIHHASVQWVEDHEEHMESIVVDYVDRNFSEHLRRDMNTKLIELSQPTQRNDDVEEDWH